MEHKAKGAGGHSVSWQNFFHGSRRSFRLAWHSCVVPLVPQPLLNRSVPSSLCANPAGPFPQSPEHCRGICLPRGSTLLLSCWILECACQPCPPSLSKIPLDGNTDIKCIDWSQNHRAEWLEGTSGDHLVQPLCSETDQLQQVTQDCVLLGFCYLKGWRLYSLLGNPFQCLINLTVKKLFLMFKQNFWCFNLCPLHLILSLDTIENGLAKSSALSSIRYSYTLIRGPWVFNCNPWNYCSHWFSSMRSVKPKQKKKGKRGKKSK